MGLFKQIAEPLVARNVPVIPLRPRTKIAFLSNWQDLATTNEEKIQEWDAEYADANGACVAFAKPGGVWFFEVDKPGFHNEIERITGKQFPTTMTVCSSPGRGHFYFHQTPASIAMGNTQGKDEQGKEAWSARVDKRYVVAPQSFHPTSGKQYEIISSAEIAEAPDWLIEWCIKNNATDTIRVNASPEGPEIPHGSHDTELFRIACMLRNAGMDYDQIRDNLIIVCEKRCTGHGADYIDMCENKARSACKYKVGSASPIAVLGQSTGQGTATATAMAPEVTPPEFKAIPYPVFPEWVMQGTSLYEGFIEPICSKNSRYPEFMFMPGVVLILNYLGGKVGIVDKKSITGFYMVAIGQKGRVLKSSSIDSAMDYMKVVGIVREAGSANAEGHTLIFQPGSTEGLGMQMSKTNCKNAVMFYDELSTLTSKASIEGSSMKGHLLTMYGSGHFSNAVKANKETFTFPAMSYTASLIASTTDKNFLSQWSRMGGVDSGLDDRFFFLYQPEQLIEMTPQILVPTIEGSARTRKLIDQAVLKGMYQIEDQHLLVEGIKKYGNRGADRIEKMALYFAIDRGMESITDDCLERGVAVMHYEAAVKKYLAVFEATNTEATIQNQVIQLLQRNSGRLGLRELNRSMHPEKYGTSVWTKAYRGLIQGGWIAEAGNGVKGDPELVVLMRLPEEEE